MASYVRHGCGSFDAELEMDSVTTSKFHATGDASPCTETTEAFTHDKIQAFIKVQTGGNLLQSVVGKRVTPVMFQGPRVIQGT